MIVRCLDDASITVTDFPFGLTLTVDRLTGLSDLNNPLGIGIRIGHGVDDDVTERSIGGRDDDEEGCGQFSPVLEIGDSVAKVLVRLSALKL
jgi:hypothetical protein